MRYVLLGLLIVSTSLAQSADENIQVEYQVLMQTLEPGSGSPSSEAAAAERAEQFRSKLEQFAARWKVRASDLTTGRFVLGRALAQGGKLEDAIVQLDQFRGSHPDHADADQATVTVGTAHLDLGHKDRAEEVLRKFLADRPQSAQRPVALYYLALTRDAAGATDDGLVLLGEALTAGLVAPLDADAEIKRVEFLRDLGRAEEARKSLAPMLAKSPEAAYLLALDEQLAWIGKVAPEWTAIDAWLQGEPRLLASMQGKVVVLTFFADFYGACQAELAQLGEVSRREVGGDVQVVGITKYYRGRKGTTPEEERAILQGVLTTARAEFPVAVANDFSNLQAYGVRGVPWTLILDRTGRVAFLGVGARREGLPRGFDVALQRVKAR